MFGRVDTVMKVAPGSGIVSASVLLSDDLDEIDWEALGGDPGNIQTNYFSKGVEPSGVTTSGNPSIVFEKECFDSYTVDWTANEINWMIDGVSVLTKNLPDDQALPSTPCQIKIGIWAAGDPANNPNGPNGTLPSLSSDLLSRFSDACSPAQDGLERRITPRDPSP